LPFSILPVGILLKRCPKTCFQRGINSTRLVTDSTGTVVHSAQYDPYGGLYKTWIDSYHPKSGFSGKEREFGSEMDYFGARYYVHKQYRFLSVDPIISKEDAITEPQLWNLYSYCRNNPISLLDPDGKDIFQDISNWWSGTPLSHFLSGDTAGGFKILGEHFRVQMSDPGFALGFIGSVNFGGKIHNPWGRKGGPRHSNLIDNLASQLEKRGFEITREKFVSIPEGGLKSKRFGDLHILGQGEEYILQVGKQTKSGSPISREIKAIKDLEKAGFRVDFVPYNKEIK